MNNSPMTAEDLTLYAMHLLEPAEAARVEDLLRNSPEARQELVEVRGDLALLAFTTEQHTPPPTTRQRLLNQLAREPRSAPTLAPSSALAAEPVPVSMQVPERSLGQDLFVPSSRTQDPSTRAQESSGETQVHTESAPLVFRTAAEQSPEPRKSFLSMFLPWTGWAVAAALAVATFNLYRQSDALHERLAVQVAAMQRATANSARAQAVLDTLRSNEAQRFLLTKTDAQPVMQARVTYLASNGSLVFQGSNLDALPRNKTYELWLIPAAKDSQPIGAGLFKPDERGDASVILPELPKGVVAGKFGVTMEDDGGAATPTAPILMIGQ